MSSETKRELAEQAILFSKYLINKEPPDRAVTLFMNTFTKNRNLNNKDVQLLQISMKYPFAIGFIDAGLVFHNPDSEVRRRIYTMFAILECQPELADSFLTTKRNKFYFLFIGLVGVRAICRTVIGSLIVRVA